MESDRALVKKGCTLKLVFDDLSTIKYFQNPLHKISLSALTPDTSRLESGKRIAISKRYETSLKKSKWGFRDALIIHTIRLLLQ